jgi:hypothetical protein
MREAAGLVLGPALVRVIYGGDIGAGEFIVLGSRRGTVVRMSRDSGQCIGRALHAGGAGDVWPVVVDTSTINGDALWSEPDPERQGVAVLSLVKWSEVVARHAVVTAAGVAR